MGQCYRSLFWFFFPFDAFSDISFPFPVAISDRHVTLKYFLHIFSSAKNFPSIPFSIRSSIINDLIFICGRRCAVVSSIDRFFFHMNCHVWEIQEGVIHRYKSW